MKAQTQHRTQNPRSKAMKTFDPKEGFKKGKEKVIDERQKVYQLRISRAIFFLRAIEILVIFLQNWVGRVFFRSSSLKCKVFEALQVRNTCRSISFT